MGFDLATDHSEVLFVPSGSGVVSSTASYRRRQVDLREGRGGVPRFATKDSPFWFSIVLRDALDIAPARHREGCTRATSLEYLPHLML